MERTRARTHARTHPRTHARTHTHTHMKKKPTYQAPPEKLQKACTFTLVMLHIKPLFSVEEFQAVLLQIKPMNEVGMNPQYVDTVFRIRF